MLSALIAAFRRQSTLAMSGPDIAVHLAFAVALVALAALTTRLMLRRARIMDHPTARSSHRTATPRAGGISIVLTFLAGTAALGLADPTLLCRGHFVGLVSATVFVAAISFYDDVAHLSVATRLLAQSLAVAGVVASGIVADEITLPWAGAMPLGWLGVPLSFLWILGLTNAFNFMDGLDGLAAGTAAIASAFLLAITFGLGSSFVYLYAYALLAGCLGFLVYNFPPARIFMGDVGSATLGFVFATLAIVAARYDASHAPLPVVPLLLFTFVFDTCFTFVRRLWRREDVTQAHRSHLYQLLNRMGYSHRAVTLGHYAAGVVLGCVALWTAWKGGAWAAAAFVPVLLAHLAYGVFVVRLARRRGLLDESGSETGLA